MSQASKNSISKFMSDREVVDRILNHIANKTTDRKIGRHDAVDCGARARRRRARV